MSVLPATGAARAVGTQPLERRAAPVRLVWPVRPRRGLHLSRAPCPRRASARAAARRGRPPAVSPTMSPSMTFRSALSAADPRRRPRTGCGRAYPSSPRACTVATALTAGAVLTALMVRTAGSTGSPVGCRAATSPTRFLPRSPVTSPRRPPRAAPLRIGPVALLRRRRTTRRRRSGLRRLLRPLGGSVVRSPVRRRVGRTAPKRRGVLRRAPTAVPPRLRRLRRRWP